MFLLCGFAISSMAQTVDRDSVPLRIYEVVDSLEVRCDTLTDSVPQKAVVRAIITPIPFKIDTVWKRYPHPLCLPLMFLPEEFPALNDTTQEQPYSIAMIRQNARRYLTANHADVYVSISDPSRLKELEIGKTRVHRAIVKDIEEEKLDVGRAIRNSRSPWRKEANVSLQLTQNYATENWHQGAVNAFAMLWSTKGFVNYKKDNLSWENNAEWRVGVSTVSGDTLRKMNTTDDIFQLYSKLGYQVHKKWYITLFADFKTNLFPNFKKNTNKLNATIFTPIRYTMGIGVDYKPLKGLSINLSPATYKLIYTFTTDPERVDVTEYGVATGQNMLNEVGSSLRVQWKWQPLREIKLDTKFYFFTNYKQIETELEVNVDFIINKYMSAKLILHPRYDGTIDDVAERKSELQFKELISVGFAHTFR